MWHCIPFRSAWNDIRMYKRILCGFLIQTVDNNLQGTGTVCEGLLNAKVISDEFCILKIYFAGKSTVDCFIFVLGKGSLLPTPELRLRFRVQNKQQICGGVRMMGSGSSSSVMKF